MAGGLSYREAGVDIDHADAVKRFFAESMHRGMNPRVLSRVGAFAALYDLHFRELSSPVLVVKTEEPGSKQLLAAQHGRLPDVAYDLINHLLNDTVLVGARPLGVVDTIVCGKLQGEIVSKLVANMAEACRAQGCDLVGGETSEQPGVLAEGVYVLSAAAFGIVDRSRIIDGRSICAGDVVMAVASNGVHTNGYSLIRKLLERQPDLLQRNVDGKAFLDAVLLPHRCYNLPLQEVFANVEVHGIAHITGGGIVDNTARIVPSGLEVRIDLGLIRVLPVFRVIKEAGGVPLQDMLRTFNLGVGLVAIMPPASEDAFKKIFFAYGDDVYRIGEVVVGAGGVVCGGTLKM